MKTLLFSALLLWASLSVAAQPTGSLLNSLSYLDGPDREYNFMDSGDFDPGTKWKELSKDDSMTAYSSNAGRTHGAHKIYITKQNGSVDNVLYYDGHQTTQGTISIPFRVIKMTGNRVSYVLNCADISTQNEAFPKRYYSCFVINDEICNRIYKLTDTRSANQLRQDPNREARIRKIIYDKELWAQTQNKLKEANKELKPTLIKALNMKETRNGKVTSFLYGDNSKLSPVDQSEYRAWNDRYDVLNVNQILKSCKVFDSQKQGGSSSGATSVP